MHRMSPTELFEEARLDEAVARQAAIVREHADDIGERMLLCDLLAFTGDRAAVRQQLFALSTGTADLRPYLAEWHLLLAADHRRHAGERPGFLIDPPPHARRRLEVLDRLRAERAADLRDWIDAADEAAPWVEGHVDGRHFDGWRDADDLVGPMLEVFHSGRYYWAPVDQIRKLRVEPEETLRDRLYRPTTLWLTDGAEHEVFLPTLYAGTADHPEEGIRSGAGMDWAERNGLLRGAGSRLYLFGEEELAPAEFRQVEVKRAYGH
ncbi:MAG TPA: type VI secretion system accessory protein TagJ [Gemmataceae bacterium]|nr:type VI secretion system accessory protein TagJ [Gemmataceae bacterium]